MIPSNNEWWGDEQGAGDRALQRLAAGVAEPAPRGPGLAGSSSRSATPARRYGPVAALAGTSLELRGGRVPDAARAVGLGQDHAADADRRPGAAERRRDLDRRQAGHLRRAGQARHRRGVPELRAVPASDDRGEHRLPAAHAPDAGETHQAGGRARRSTSSSLPHVGRAAAARALGRPAAAHRARALHRLPALDHPDGRAARRARPQAARPDAARDQGAPPRASASRSST